MQFGQFAVTEADKDESEADKIVYYSEFSIYRGWRGKRKMHGISKCTVYRVLTFQDEIGTKRTEHTTQSYHVAYIMFFTFIIYKRCGSMFHRYYFNKTLSISKLFK